MNGLDIVDVLNLEYERKCQKNPKYSLRAFARDLGVPAASLSHIMKGNRPANKQFRKKVSESMKLSFDQKVYLEEHSGETFKFSPSDKELFLSLSEWYYDAILELVRTKGFKSKVEFVAERLDISVQEAKMAVERMIDLGMITVMPNKSWVTPNENVLMYGGDVTSFALQKLQRQLMERAIDALEEIPKKKREQASMTMAINQKDLPEVKKLIKTFHQELCKYTQRPHRTTDEVYQLVTAFFPLTKLDD